MKLLIALVMFGTVVQWIIVVTILQIDYEYKDKGVILFFETKKSVLLWLIPFYMPIKNLLKIMSERWSELK